MSSRRFRRKQDQLLAEYTDGYTQYQLSLHIIER